MRTVLALVLAVAMIAGALVIRGRGAGAPGVLTPDQPLTVVCASELEQACRSLASGDVAVRVEPAGVTAAALSSGGDQPADAWLTIAPLPQIVAENRARGGLEPVSDAQPVALGRSPLVLVVRKDREAVLEQHCDGGVAWPCIGRVADESWADIGGETTWGRIKPGHMHPSRTATGLLVLGQAVSQFLDTPDFSASDLAGDRLLGWLTTLERGVPDFGADQNTPLQQMLRLSATFDVVGTTEAEAVRLLQRSGQRAGNLSVRYPEPLVVATAVLAPLRPGNDDRLDDMTEPARVAVAEAGWRVDGQPSAAGAPDEPPLPEQDNVPAPGALEALRLRWEEITR